MRLGCFDRSVRPSGPTLAFVRTAGFDPAVLSGRRFHPGHSWTYQRQPLSGRRLINSLLGVALIVSPLAVAALQDAGTLTIPILFWPLLFVGPAMVVTGFAIECEVLRTSTQALTGRLPWVEHELAFAAALVVSVLIVAAAVGAVVVRF